ncbi:pentapeptide repeat-containing protein [Alysiella filiformis]
MFVGADFISGNLCKTRFVGADFISAPFRFAEIFILINKLKKGRI